MAGLLLALDAALLVVIVLAAVDYLRATYFMNRPAACVAVYMVAIGSFGLLLAAIDGREPSPWSVMLHLGITVYAATHYRDVIDNDWQWDGKDRRVGRQS